MGAKLWYFSWPAVSQIWHLQGLPLFTIILDMNDAPIVDSPCGRNVSVT